MTAPLSYINVHPPADPPPPPLLCPHPPAAVWLWGNYNMIMTGTKALELITGHNTSFSALIRRLIGNRFACFPPLLLSRHAAEWRRIQTGGFFHIIMSASLFLPEGWSVCWASSPVTPTHTRPSPFHVWLEIRVSCCWGQEQSAPAPPLFARHGCSLAAGDQAGTGPPLCPSPCCCPCMSLIHGVR